MAFGVDDALLAVAGAQVVGGLLGSDSAKSAASSQANAANNAAATQLRMFDTVNNQNAPYRQAGYNALSQLFQGAPITVSGPREKSEWVADNYPGGVGVGPLGNLSPDAGYADYLAKFQPNTTVDMSRGLDPYFTKQFGANDLNANLAPNWQFALEQGQGAAKNALNLTNGVGGNFAKGLVDYTINKSGDQYQQAYQNFTNNQSNIFNRLATIAGFGTGANTVTANAATTAGANIGNAQMAAGAAEAAGTVGSTNAITGAANNAASWFALPSILKLGQTQIGAGPG